MKITDPMSRTCLAMLAGLVLVSVGVGDDRGQGRGDQPLRFAGPLAVHPRNPRYFVDGSGKAIYKQDPPANEESRPTIMDMDHISPSGSDDRILPWKALTRGYHYSMYDHPFENRRDEGPSWELARRNVGAAVSYSRRFSDLAAAGPHGELSSTKYCLAHPGREYLVLQPEPDKPFTMNLAPGDYRYEWFCPDRAKVDEAGSIRVAGGDRRFVTPFRGPAVLFLAGPEEKSPARSELPDKSWKTWLDRKLLPEQEARSMMSGFFQRQLRPLPLPETREAWLARCDGLRREVLAVLGIDDLVPPKWDLALKPKGTLRRPGYRIEKITFESYPGMAIPAIVYVPEGITGRVPGIVSISGHTNISKAADYVQQRNVNLALRGCVVLSYDYHGYGERKTGSDPNHPTGSNTHDIRSFSFSRRTATAIEVLDAIRAIDVLSARAEVDPERIGFTGESGGSNSTYWVAAVDPRVKLAVPVSSVTTFDYWIRTDCNWDWHQRPPGGQVSVVGSRR